VHDQAYVGARSLAVGNMSGDSRPEIAVGGGSPSSSDSVRILQLDAATPLTVASQHTTTQDSREVPGRLRGW
jgi:hypothetical protein